MKTEKIGSANTFTSRPQLGRRTSRQEKAPTDYRPEPNAFARILDSEVKKANVQVQAKLNISGKEQIFYVKFPKNLLNDYKANKRISKSDLNQIEVRFDTSKEFKSLETLTKARKKDTLDDYSLKRILAFAVENVVDEYRGATTLKKLHDPQT